MSLNKNNTKLAKDDLDQYQGIYALWGLIFINFTTFFCVGLFCVTLVSVTNLTIYNFIFYGALIALFQSTVWNCMHPALHFEDKQLTISEGPDFINRKWFQSTGLHKWLWTNHVIHHLVSGKKQGNYNAVLPGADYLFGTYRNRSDCPGFIINSEELTIQKKSIEPDIFNVDFKKKMRDDQIADALEGDKDEEENKKERTHDRRM